MKKFLIYQALLIALTLIGCGSSNRIFDNPNDPNKEIKDANPDAAVDSKTPNEGVDSETVPSPTDKSSQNTTSNCLLSTCNPTAGTTFNFANVFKITPSGCTDISQIKMFDTGTNIRIFLKGNCGQRFGVYSFRVEYNGSNPTTPTLLSINCNTGTNTIENFDIDKGSNGYLLVAHCKITTNSYNTRIIAVDNVGANIADNVYETSNTAKTYQIAWNSGANAYGTARSGQFQRFNESAVTIGGPISVYTQGYMGSGLYVSANNWELIQNANQAPKCSRINTSGVLSCNAKDLNLSYESNGYTYPYNICGSLPSFGKIFVCPTASYSSNSFSIISTNQSDCSPSLDFSPILTLSSLKMAFGGIPVSSTVGGFLFKSENSLIFATFTLNGGSLQAENSISGFSSSMNNADVKIIGNKIYVAYDKDGDGFISYSNETVPQ